MSFMILYVTASNIIWLSFSIRRYTVIIVVKPTFGKIYYILFCKYFFWNLEISVALEKSQSNLKLPSVSSDCFSKMLVVARLC